MLIACGIVCLLLGAIGLVGQLISTLNFPLAQRLGLQEKADHCEPLYSHLELNTARWDLAVLWTLPLAGLLMLLGHGWWPAAALVAGGAHVDTGGREIAKLLALRAHGIRMGTDQEHRQGLAFLALLSVTGLWAVAMALIRIAS